MILSPTKNNTIDSLKILNLAFNISITMQSPISEINVLQDISTLIAQSRSNLVIP